MFHSRRVWVQYLVRELRPCMPPCVANYFFPIKSNLFVFLFCYLLLWKSQRLMAPVSQGPCIIIKCIWNMLPCWLSCKESVCQCKKCMRRCVFDPWVGKIPWSRAWQPIPLFLPGKSPWAENLMDRESNRQRILFHRITQRWTHSVHSYSCIHGRHWHTWITL